jgi:hypothetical protein
LEILPPLSQKDIVVYACTSPLGNIKLKAQGDAVYGLVSNSADVPRLTRGLKIREKAGGGKNLPSELTEDALSIKTSRK